MKNKVVLFDIDYTLFNAKKYREKFTEKLAKALRYTGSDFNKHADSAYKEHRETHAYFDPVIFAQTLSRKLSLLVDAEELKQIILSEKILEESLYDDTIRVLSRLAEYKELTLGIFSAGLLHVQEPKIKQIRHFLHEDHIHIYEFRKQHALPQLMEKYKKDFVIIVDDIQEVLHIAKQNKPDVHTVLIRRTEEGSLRIDNFHPDSIIRSLDEVVPVVLGESAV